jgi:hypothetical protein
MIVMAIFPYRSLYGMANKAAAFILHTAVEQSLFCQ